MYTPPPFPLCRQAEARTTRGGPPRPCASRAQAERERRRYLTYSTFSTFSSTYITYIAYISCSDVLVVEAYACRTRIHSDADTSAEGGTRTQG